MSDKFQTRFTAVILIIFQCILIFGCAVTDKSLNQTLQTLKPAVGNHVVVLNSEGEIREISDGIGGFLVASESSGSIQIDRIVSAIKTNVSTKKVVLFFHGGLVSESSLLKRVDKLLGHMPDDVYPIFIHWPSGPFSTYFKQLSAIRNGEHSSWAKYNWPVYLATDVLDILVHAPRSWMNSGAHAFDAGILRKLPEIEASLNSYAQAGELVNVVKSGEPPNKLGSSARWWLFSPLKAVTTAGAYPVGKQAWDEMLRRADNVVFPFERKIDDLASVNVSDLSLYRDNEDKPVSAIDKLLEALNMLRGVDSPRFEIDLVGHSMGAIIVNRILRSHRNILFNNIVHMASADTVDAMFSSVFPYMENNEGTRFYSLHLHPKNEEREQNLYGIAPTGSLLVYIEDMFTSPEAVMSRRSGIWDNIAKSFDRLPQSESMRSRIAFTIFGMDKNALEGNGEDKISRVVHPQKHGDFGRTRFWMRETWLGENVWSSN